MSPHKYAAPLQITPNPSFRLAALLLIFITGAGVLLFTVPLHWAARLLALTAILAISYTNYRRHFGARRITRAVWDEEGEWTLAFADGTEQKGVLRGDSVIASWLVLLNFDVEKRFVSIALLSDSIDSNTMRRLRVRLRLQGAPRADDKKSDVDPSLQVRVPKVSDRLPEEKG